MPRADTNTNTAAVRTKRCSARLHRGRCVRCRQSSAARWAARPDLTLCKTSRYPTSHGGGATLHGGNLPGTTWVRRVTVLPSAAFTWSDSGEVEQASRSHVTEERRREGPLANIRLGPSMTSLYITVWQLPVLRGSVSLPPCSSTGSTNSFHSTPSSLSAVLCSRPVGKPSTADFQRALLDTLLTLCHLRSGHGIENYIGNDPTRCRTLPWHFLNITASCMRRIFVWRKRARRALRKRTCR